MKSIVNISILILLAFTISICPINVTMLSFDFIKPLDEKQVDENIPVDEETIVNYSYDLPGKEDYIKNPTQMDFAINFDTTPEVEAINGIDEGITLDFYKNDSLIKSFSLHDLNIDIFENATETLSSRIYNISLDNNFLNLKNGNYTVTFYSKYEDLKDIEPLSFEVEIFDKIEYFRAMENQVNDGFLTVAYYLNHDKTITVPVTKKLSNSSKYIRNTINELFYNPLPGIYGLLDTPTSPKIVNLALNNGHIDCYINEKDSADFLVDGKIPDSILESISKTLLNFNSINSVSFVINGEKITSPVLSIDGPKAYVSYITDNDIAYLVPVLIENEEDIVPKLFESLRDLNFENPHKEVLTNTIPRDVKLLRYSIKKSTIDLTFSEDLLTAYDKDSTYFSLMIDSIINTFTSIDNIDRVKISVDGNDLKEYNDYNFENPMFERKYINPAF